MCDVLVLFLYSSLMVVLAGVIFFFVEKIVAHRDCWYNGCWQSGCFENRLVNASILNIYIVFKLASLGNDQCDIINIVCYVIHI